jgi:glutamate racemase
MVTYLDTCKFSAAHCPLLAQAVVVIFAVILAVYLLRQVRTLIAACNTASAAPLAPRFVLT